MPSTEQFITNLKKAKLTAECPKCFNEFQVAKALLFDGTNPFPPKAENAKNELMMQITERQNEIKERQNELKKFKVSVDKTSETGAVSVGIGKILEKVLPYYKDFKIPLSDCRFLAEPLDVIVFDGASRNDVKNIIFMDIKTGDAGLQKNQRQIRDAVLDNKVRSELL